MNIQKISKAIAGALVAGLIAYLVDKGIFLGSELTDALNVITSALIGGLVVYLAPKNKV